MEHIMWNAQAGMIGARNNQMMERQGSAANYSDQKIVPPKNKTAGAARTSVTQHSGG
jgi:hypothetical protein